MSKIKIAVDAMGGDFAPLNDVSGAIIAAEEKSETLEIILVGKEKLIQDELLKHKVSLKNISIVNAEEIVTMKDSPVESLKSKPDSSISVGLDLVKQKKADGFISAGNTGAVMTASILKLGRIKGVGRPTIGSLFPTDKGKTMVFDVGASVDCKAVHLLEFAVMGSIFMKNIHKIDKPSIGLLSVGEEKSKGDTLTIEAYELLEKSNLNFIGNVEGRDVLRGKADIIVCDGFVGNVILKFAESILDVMKSKFKTYAEKGFFHKLWVGMMYGTLKNVVLKDFDYQEYGGVPLLGVDGVSIIGHGKSSPIAIKNMIYKAEEMVRSEVNEKIRKELSIDKS
ncbi:MAG TPA: phosphate acyltransferase PlsX [Ignavibacteria bacterium]|nr:phosphate acyltransferase PlsX [Ignavibacteria bacterium]HRA99797.1 phosphate acyltransferase PlsX [Ignavibacteria bacterium]